MLFGRRGWAGFCLAVFAIFWALPVGAVSGFSQSQILEENCGATGWVQILKTDLKGKPIPGTQYRLLREVTLEEHREGKLQTEWIQINGEEREMTQVSFCLSGSSPSEPVFRVSTGEDGVAVFSCLPYGIYYIQEVSPCPGYEPQPQPVEARINAQTSGATILIETNQEVSREPPVATLITAALVAVTSSAGILILMNGKGKWP